MCIEYHVHFLLRRWQKGGVISYISKYARDKAESLPNDEKEFKILLLAELREYDRWDPWEGQKK